MSINLICLLNKHEILNYCFIMDIIVNYGDIIVMVNYGYRRCDYRYRYGYGNIAIMVMAEMMVIVFFQVIVMAHFTITITINNPEADHEEWVS